MFWRQTTPSGTNKPKSINNPVAPKGAKYALRPQTRDSRFIVTTNLPFSEWGQVLPNPRLCQALVDRLTDRAHIIETGTESFRFRRTLAQRDQRRRPQGKEASLPKEADALTQHE